MIAQYFAIAIPTFTIIFGILLNRSDYNSSRGEMQRIEQTLRAEIHGLEYNLREEMTASRKQSHDDLMVLVGIAREQESRVTRLEARS
jgi:hypothetical protein